MGILDRLLGSGKKDHPPLAPDSDAGRRVEELREPLETLARETGEALEIVPSGAVAYVFIGKPPKKFGLAWIRDGKVSNFKTLVDEKHLSPIRMERLTDTLREAYERSADAERYATTIGGQQAVVTPSAELAREVHALIEEVSG